MAMRRTLTLREEDFDRLNTAIFSRPNVEGAAYLMCGRSTTSVETRWLCRDVVPVRDEHYLIREPARLSIDSSSYASVAKHAETKGESVIFVHSHPGGIDDFSPQDDREEPKLMQFLDDRAPSGRHGSLVVTDKPTVRGRIWASGKWGRLDRVRVLGTRFRFFGESTDGPLPVFFERQVRAFGPDIQRLIGHLHIGVVGAGGTGSIVIEQLARLGVGTISVFDGDQFEPSNVNRVYGSSIGDEARGKARIAGDHVERIGLGTIVRAFERPITEEAIAKELRDCDIIFGCTDNETPRAFLVQIALRYLIPVIDTAVKIDSDSGEIRGVFGRVTTLLPGEACLFCRGRITPAGIALEGRTKEERRRLAGEGYAPELQVNNPAVIAFTTAVGAQAITELLHRLTGFMGAERLSTEVLLRVHDTEVGRNRERPNPSCLCQRRDLWGRGDFKGPFLGVLWAA
jgi:molybdopterin/thiamine biosynthesis adenylyltransferase/proteasome lid subunit RPN8/RPN11